MAAVFSPRVGIADEVLDQSERQQSKGAFSFPDFMVLLAGITLLFVFGTLKWLDIDTMHLHETPFKLGGQIVSELPDNTEVQITGSYIDEARNVWLLVNDDGSEGWLSSNLASDQLGVCDEIPVYAQTDDGFVIDPDGRNRVRGDGEGLCRTTSVEFQPMTLTAWQALDITSQSLMFILFAGLIGVVAGTLGVIFPGARVNTALLSLAGGVMGLWYFYIFWREDWARRAEELVAYVPASDFTEIGFWVAHIIIFALVIQIAMPRPGLRQGPWVLTNLGSYLREVWRNMRKNPILYLMLLPGVIWFAVFQYGPMYGATIAFKEYRVLDGILGSPWTGFEHFRVIFSSAYFTEILRNTIIISMLKFFIGVPAAVTLAILMNEVRTKWFKRSVQTITYMPHFLSWVVISGIAIAMLGQADGLVNNTIQDIGGDTVNFLGSPDWFRQVLVTTDLWKTMGFEAIIYLAAIAGISPELYEAAAVDGAGRFRRILYITIPGILPVVVLVALLNIGYVLSAGFEQVFVLYSIPVYSVGDIIDTWVYRRGLEQFQFDLAAAMGLFKGVVGMILILSMNWLAKRLTGSGIW